MQRRLPGKKDNLSRGDSSRVFGSGSLSLHSGPFGLSCIKKMTLTTIIGLVAAFCTTASFLPQAIQTIRTKNTSGISLSMYSLFAVGTLFWLIYGIADSNSPVIIANGITLVFAVIILIYKIIYK